MTENRRRRPCRFPFGKLYPIAGTGHPEQTLSLASAFLQGGASLLQVREKRMPDRQLHQLLRQVGDDCRRHQALLVVNDRVDLALAVKAGGVHLGQDDLPVEAARDLVGPRVLIGLSTHNRLQFEEAQSRPIDYLAIGPIFATETKAGENPEVGLAAFREMAQTSRLPVVAIGGIDLQRALDLWAAGADSVAVVSDLACHPDPSQRVAEYLKAAEDIKA